MQFLLDLASGVLLHVVKAMQLIMEPSTGVDQIASQAVEFVGRLIDPLREEIGGGLVQKAAAGIGSDVLLEALQEALTQLCFIGRDPQEHAGNMTLGVVQVCDQLTTITR